MVSVDVKTPQDMPKKHKKAPAAQSQKSSQSSDAVVAELQQQLKQAQEAEKRALADYQNVIRRNQEERVQFAKMATREMVSDLLQPLEHLSMAAAQLDDTGLNMVIDQLWAKLKDHGLEEIDPQGQPFNIETMEVVENQTTENGAQLELETLVVTKVQRKGYRLNGQVIQFARVTLGEPTA